MNNEVKLKGLAGLAHLLSPSAEWAYYDSARYVRDYVKEQTLSIAAKDAELWRALHTLEALVAAGFVTQEKVDEARALMANLQPSAPVHPDAARLDKLPQCFHMIRFAVGNGKWWLTYEPNKAYSSVREAIDAHKGTPE